MLVPRVRFVRMEGLEPPRLAAPDPKSGAATNYATSAFVHNQATRYSWITFCGRAGEPLPVLKRSANLGIIRE